MTNVKQQGTQKLHLIDREHSLKSRHVSIGHTALVSPTDHYLYLSRQVNPHLVVNARTTLSQGRGK